MLYSSCPLDSTSLDNILYNFFFFFLAKSTSFRQNIRVVFNIRGAMLTEIDLDAKIILNCVNYLLF